MTVTITLPDELATKLQSRAETKNLSLETLAINILSSVLELKEELDDYPTPEEVVAKIKATPPIRRLLDPLPARWLRPCKTLPTTPTLILKPGPRSGRPLRRLAIGNR